MKRSDFSINKESSWVNMLIRDGLNKLEGVQNDNPRFFDMSVISNIPYITYPDLTREQCDFLYSMAREVMMRSKKDNCYNEVAITYKCDADQEDEDAYAIVYGDERSVKFMADEKTAQVVNSTAKLCIVNLHNHPNNSEISARDLFIFACNSNLRVMEIINHEGLASFLYRPCQIELKETMLSVLKNNVQGIRERMDAEPDRDLFDILEDCEKNDIVKKALELFQEKGIVYAPYMDKDQAKAFAFPNADKEVEGIGSDRDSI